MIDIVFNNGWTTGEFNLLLIDFSIDHDMGRMIAAFALLGFGVAVLYYRDAEEKLKSYEQ